MEESPFLEESDRAKGREDTRRLQCLSSASLSVSYRVPAVCLALVPK